MICNCKNYNQLCIQINSGGQNEKDPTPKSVLPKHVIAAFHPMMYVQGIYGRRDLVRPLNMPNPTKHNVQKDAEKTDPKTETSVKKSNNLE